jgi:hypothetical protein
MAIGADNGMGTVGNTFTTIDGMLKEYYKDGGVIVATYKESATWTVITKRRDSNSAKGRHFVFSMKYAHNQARNVDFPTAQKMGDNVQVSGSVPLSGFLSGSEQFIQFLVPKTLNFQYANLDTETILAAQGGDGSFDDSIPSITDGALANLGMSQGISILSGYIVTAPGQTPSTGFAPRGQISVSQNVALTVLTLQNPLDSNRFEKGQQLDVYANDGTYATKRAFGANNHPLYVGKVDRNLGTLTIVDASNNAAALNGADGAVGIAAGDLLFVYNDAGNQVLSFENWVPFGGPSSALFCNVDRTSDPVRLAGNWLDATGVITATAPLQIEDAIIQGTSQVAMQSNRRTDTIIMNYNQWNKLLKSNMARKVCQIDTDVPHLSFSGIEVIVTGGKAVVMLDRFCPSNRVYLLCIDTWEFIHLGPDPVYLWDFDGNKGLREQSASAMAFRYDSIGNLVCTDPSANCTVNIAV